jgi:hypothetical protein
MFMQISCIEYLVIRVKLMDLIELELIEVAQPKVTSQLPICLLWPDRDTQGLGEIRSLASRLSNEI